MKCQKCSETITDWVNEWVVSVYGELGNIELPAIGEHVDALDVNLTLCSSCLRDPTVVQWMLARALDVERKLTRCGDCLDVIPALEAGPHPH